MIVAKNKIPAAIEREIEQAEIHIAKSKAKETRGKLCEEGLRPIVFVSQFSPRRFMVGWRFDKVENPVGYKGVYCEQPYEIVWAA